MLSESFWEDALVSFEIQLQGQQLLSVRGELATHQCEKARVHDAIVASRAGSHVQCYTRH